MSIRSTQRGFTLLEVLIAIAVFAMFAVGTFSVLNNVTSQNEVSEEHVTQVEALQRAFFIMERDFQQVAQRPVRVDGDPVSQSVFAAGRYVLDSEGDGVAFVKDGWHNPGLILPRSELQAVAYRVREESLERLFHIYTDPLTGTEPKVQLLMKDVTDLVIRYHNNGQWRERWEGSGFPQALEITVKTKALGDIRRVFLMPANNRG